MTITDYILRRATRAIAWRAAAALVAGFWSVIVFLII